MTPVLLMSSLDSALHDVRDARPASAPLSDTSSAINAVHEATTLTSERLSQSRMHRVTSALQDESGVKSRKRCTQEGKQEGVHTRRE